MRRTALRIALLVGGLLVFLAIREPLLAWLAGWGIGGVEFFLLLFLMLIGQRLETITEHLRTLNATLTQLHETLEDIELKLDQAEDGRQAARRKDERDNAVIWP